MEYKDPLGDRMKRYESLYTSQTLLSGVPVCVRLDGKAFHTFTRGLDKPYDLGLIRAMCATTEQLVKSTDALIGYTQSDEISLIYWYDGVSQPLFGGKLSKWNSLLASQATAAFNAVIPEHLPKKLGVPAHFDCRTWHVPDKEEAANTLLWRWFDARRNSVSMAAQAAFSHKSLQHKSTQEQLAMLGENGISWSEYPDAFKYGSFYQRQNYTADPSDFTELPEQYRPTEPVIRSRVVGIAMPPFLDVRNRVEVIFDRATPVLWNKNDS